MMKRYSERHVSETSLGRAQKHKTEFLKIYQVLHFLFHLRLYNANILSPIVHAYLQSLFLRFCKNLPGKAARKMHAFGITAFREGLEKQLIDIAEWLSFPLSAKTELREC